MGSAPPPHAGRWRERERVWARLSKLASVVAEADPAESGYWRIFDPGAAYPDVPIATLSDDDVHDVRTAGVKVVYRR